MDIADIERELDAEKAAKNGTVTLDYEAMLAALDTLLAEMREERRQGEASVAKNQGTSNPTHGPKRTLCSPRNSAAARNGGHEKLPMDGIGRCATAITLWLPRQPMNGARSSPRHGAVRVPGRPVP